MARPPRLLFPGALYHVTSRGNRRANIYTDNRDYLIWTDTLAETVARYRFVVHAYCQMPNHFHLLVETVEANLSEGMHYLNSMYAQRFNSRHKLTGHLVQGRFHAVVVDKDSQLLATARYIALNPLRAALVADPLEWRWGSHIHYCNGSAPSWLTTSWILTQFRANHRIPYAEFVLAGIGESNPIAKHTEWPPPADYAELEAIRSVCGTQDEAIARAYLTEKFSRQTIASFFGVSIRKVNRAVAAFRANDQ